MAAALVDEGLLPAAERDRAAGVATRVLAAQAKDVGPLRRRLAEVAGHIGGGLLIAAAALLVADYWGGMGSVARVAILAGVAVLLAVAVLVRSVLTALHQDRPLTVGLGFVLVACAWLVASELGLWREHDVGLLLGAVGLVAGAQLPISSTNGWVAYALTLAIAAGGFVAYVVRRSWPYLALGIAGVTIGMPEALMDLTHGSLGAAVVLLVAGATLLVASSLLGLLLRRVKRAE